MVALLPLARQVAGSLGPWLLALLAERERLGLARWAVGSAEQGAEVLADIDQQPCTRQEAQRGGRWLRWLLEAELLRLARLLEAPAAMMRRREWLGWEVRYWALAVSLACVGQLYAALERRQGREAATQTLEAALALAWWQATVAARAA